LGLLKKGEVLRLLVADSTQMGCQLLSGALRRSHRFDVTSGTNSREVLKMAASHNPQVAVIRANLEEEPLGGLRVMRQIHLAHHQTKVVALLDSSQKELVVEAFRAGASGVFCRVGSIKLLSKCIEAVYSGQVWANTEELRYLLGTLSEAVPLRLVDARGVELLSKRELDVVHGVSEGLSNREIALQLKLSEHTVKNYLFRIFDKLGVSNRVELLLYVFSQDGQTHNSNLLAGKKSDMSDAEESPLGANQKAAEEGSDLAQFILGKMYSRGHGVARDLMASYMWLQLAESTNNFLRVRIKLEKSRIARNLRAPQISEAQRQASIWLNGHPRQATVCCQYKVAGQTRKLDTGPSSR
jgi:DNA-binding NarL/FixJ family response regulator